MLGQSVEKYLLEDQCKWYAWSGFKIKKEENKTYQKHKMFD